MGEKESNSVLDNIQIAQLLLDQAFSGNHPTSHVIQFITMAERLIKSPGNLSLKELAILNGNIEPDDSYRPPTPGLARNAAELQASPLDLSPRHEHH